VAGTCNRHERDGKHILYRSFVGKPEGKKTTWQSLVVDRNRLLKTIFKEFGVRMWTVINSTIKLRVL